MLELFEKGGFFIWPILMCSIISLTVILDRFYYFFRTRLRQKDLPEQVRELIQTGRNDTAISICHKQAGFIGRFLSAGVKTSDRGEDYQGKALRWAGSKELAESEKHLRILAVIGNTATLLGLLGTVTGMIKTFVRIESSGGVAEITILAGGIWEALLTTAAGLSVAIPTLVFYHYFEGMADARALELKDIASDVFDVH